MSITALASDAARLLAYFQAEEAAIDAAVAAAVAAVPSLVKTYYVDSVNGLNTNTGTSAAPLQTLDYALSLMANKSGMRFNFYLKAGQTFTIGADVYVSNSNIRWHKWDSGANPVISLGFRVTTLAGTDYASNYGIQAPGCYMQFMGGVDLKTPETPVEHAALTVWAGAGLFRGLPCPFSILNATIDLGDIPLIPHGLDTPHAMLLSVVTIVATGDGMLVALGSIPVTLAVSSLTLPGGTTLDDFVSGVSYSAIGQPLNIVSNYEFVE